MNAVWPNLPQIWCWKLFSLEEWGLDDQQLEATCCSLSSPTVTVELGVVDCYDWNIVVDNVWQIADLIVYQQNLLKLYSTVLLDFAFSNM